MNKRRFTQKISNRRGATLLIALLVFLIAALSGTIALTMAASNAGRYTHEKDNQQAYLSVISAGNLILDRLKGLKIVYEGKTSGEAPTTAEEINIKYEGEGKRDLFLADTGFQKNLMRFSLDGNSKWTVMEFYLEASETSGMGKVCVSVDAVGGKFFFRLYYVSGATHNYQMTLEVGTKFGERGYTIESDKVFRRHLSFETESAKFTVERNLPSGGTEE